MSTKIYNGYKTKQNFMLRELEEKTTQLKELIQEQANNEFKELAISRIYYLYDNYKLFPEYFKKEYKELTGREYDLDSEFKEHTFLFDIICGVIRTVKAANQEETRFKYPYFYNIDAKIHIIPVKDKILILWYGENQKLKGIFDEQNWIEEYHYQNQSDMPEDITEDEWEKRKLDWEEALPKYVPSNRGFTIHLVNEERFPWMLKEVFEGQKIPTIGKRAYNLAVRHYVPEEFNGNNYEVLWSEAGKQFYRDKGKEMEPKLDKINLVM